MKIHGSCWGWMIVYIKLYKWTSQPTPFCPYYWWLTIKDGGFKCFDHPGMGIYDGQDDIWRYVYIYIWYDMIWYDMIWYDMIWYDMIWYDMIWYDMIWYDMIWYDMIWYDMIYIYIYIWYIYIYGIWRPGGWSPWASQVTSSEKDPGRPPRTARGASRGWVYAAWLQGWADEGCWTSHEIWESGTLHSCEVDGN